MVTTLDAQPGDVLRNTGWEDKFTCPNCHNDHTCHVPDGETRYITCECGARLRLEVEHVPEAACYIADPDEGEEAED